MSTTGLESGQTIADNHLIDGLPNWPAIDFDILCSRCGYNLRTLTKPKCTECGFEFDWREMITRHFNINPNLFEHGWRWRPIRAYLFTMLYPVFFPQRFWARVSLHDRIRTGPLIFLLLSLPLVLVIAVLGLSLLTAVLIDQVFGFSAGYNNTRYWYSINSNTTTRNFFSMSRTLWYSIKASVDQPRYFWPPFFCALVGPGLALWILSGFNQTIARCRLRKAHMLRVVAYSVGPTFISVALFLILFVAPINMWIEVLGITYESRWVVAPMTIGILLLPIIYQLEAAFRHYLAIPQPLFSASLIALVEALSVTAALVVVYQAW